MGKTIETQINNTTDAIQPLHTRLQHEVLRVLTCFLRRMNSAKKACVASLEVDGASQSISGLELWDYGLICHYLCQLQKKLQTDTFDLEALEFLMGLELTLATKADSSDLKELLELSCNILIVEYPAILEDAVFGGYLKMLYDNYGYKPPASAPELPKDPFSAADDDTITGLLEIDVPQSLSK